MAFTKQVQRIHGHHSGTYYEDKDGTPKYKRLSFDEKAESLKKTKPKFFDALNTFDVLLKGYGLKVRSSSSGLNYRLHCKRYAKLTIANNYLKIYLRLESSDLENTKIPFRDFSSKSSFEDIPLGFKIKSSLAIKRTINLIHLTMKKGGFTIKDGEQD
ncbi:MAG: hypothetical protein WCS80_00165 [Bacilli bacterium]